MTSLLITGYLLCATMLIQEDYTVEVEKEIPKVECQSEILIKEIKFFLDQIAYSRDTCYWNLIVQKSNITDIGSPNSIVYECTLYRDIAYDKPKKGNAYFEYGQNVIVIEGPIAKSLFKKDNDVRRKFTMYWKQLPYFSYVPFMKIKFSDNRILSLYFENYGN